MSLSLKKTTDLISHIEKEAGRCAPARKALLDQINHWYEVYEMDPTSLKRNIPFPGASACFQPLLFEETKLMYGKLWAMQFKHRPLLSISPTEFQPDDIILNITSELQHSLDHILFNEIKIREKCMPITLEGLITGMAVGYVPWRVDRRMLPVHAPGRSQPLMLPQVTYANPDLQHVPLAHCHWPPEARTIEDTRWFSIDRYYTDDELLEYAASNPDTVDKKAVLEIIQGGTDNPSEWQQKYGELIDMPSSQSPHYHFIEWWGWHREGKNMPMLYNIVYHANTLKAILSEINPYDDHQYPIAVWNFFSRPGKMLGIGTGRLLTDLNESLNEIWNQRVNAGRIANTKVFKVRKGCGLKPSDKIWPGKRLYLTSPANDVTEMDFGDVKQSSYADASDIWATADRVTSLNQLMRGNEAASHPTASGTLSLINISEENISIIGDNLRIFWSRVGRLVYSRIRQFSPPTKLLPSLPPDQGALFLEALGSEKIAFDLAAADERINPEAERQKLSTAYQMFTGYYQALIQYAELISNPDTPPAMALVAYKAAGALTMFMKRIGRNLDLKGFEQFLVEDFNAPAQQQRIPSLPSNASGGAQGESSQLPAQTPSGDSNGGGLFPRAVAG